MPAHEKALLVNLVGHAAGTIVFGLFLALFLRDRVGTRLRGSSLTSVAAALALIWNAGSLMALLLRGPHEHQGSVLETISFSALSLLPAILLHISLRDSLVPLRVGGYALSLVAVALHISEIWLDHPDIHRIGLLLITGGFGFLTAISGGIAVVRGRTARGSRLVGSMSLALFAMSFVHFGAHDGHAWSSELFFHHAGLPLAIFVLLQDYRFLLLDAFLRFLASAVLAGLVAAAALRAPPPEPGDAALRHGLTLAFLGVLLLAFAMLHEWLQIWLTRTVFGRPDAANASRKLRSEGPDSEDEYVDWAVIQLGRFLNSERSEAVDSVDACGNPSPHPSADHLHYGEEQPDWVEAVAPVNGPPGARRLFRFGRRRGGLRYLSEDYQFLAQMMAVITERLSEFRTRETQRLLSEAELKALQSQINPHFLFNTLNTIYGSIPRESPDARRMVRNLSDIFRYSLQDSAVTVTIARELEIVQAYLDIEALRFPTRLQCQVEVAPETTQCRIPMLTIQPLVENSIKHAIAPNPDGGSISVQIQLEADGVVLIQVSDSGRGSGAAMAVGAEIGLANVRRRLNLHFSGGGSMETSFRPDGSVVSLRIPQTAHSMEKCS